jgi:hypothetical protein
MSQIDPLSSTYRLLEHSNYYIHCHEELKCRGTFCTLHNRSNHPLRHMRQHWRSDRGIMERICQHGVGHPDPDELQIQNGKDDGIHGCDGCCR